jgi:iron complex outermembrane receptor protein
MRHSCLFFLILIILILNTALYSKESSDTKTDTIEVKYVLNPIIKTATKVAHAQRDLAASVSMISEETMKSAPTSAVLEVLQHQVPSLFVTEWGAMGYGAAGQAAGKISIRGMGGGANTHVLILRNGRPDFMGLMGCTIADEFSTDGVERIEVIRGPGSFLYGTNATGGIINIIPKKRKDDGFETSIGTGYGSFDTRKLSLAHGGKKRHFDYYLTANHRQTDGHREGSDYNAQFYTLHTGYQFGKNTLVDFNFNLADMRVNDPSLITDPKSDEWYDIFRYGGDLNLIHNSRWGESNLKLHGNFGHHEFFDGWRSNDRTLGFMAYHNAKPWRGNTMTLGFDYKRYGGDAVDAGTDYGEFFMVEYAPYLHVQQLIWQRFILTAGIRMENHELYGKEWLPKAGLVTHITRMTTLRFSAAKGFRSPSIRELYFWMPANDQLTPDRVWNYEVGLSQDFGTKCHLELAVFQSRGSNLIQFSSPPPKWINSGEYTQTGYEVFINWIPNDDFSFGGSWSDLDLNEYVFNIPAKKLTFYSKYTLWKLTFSGNLIWIQDLKGTSYPGPSPVPVLHSMDDYTLVKFVRAIIFTKV